MRKEFLYLVGNGVVETSCCGPWGCQYAVVPGSIVSWKPATDENGFFISILAPVRDEELQEGLRKMLFRREGGQPGSILVELELQKVLDNAPK